MQSKAQTSQKCEEKIWGTEILYTPPNAQQVGRILMMKAGYRNSFQFHDQKDETLCLVSGQVLLWLENTIGGLEKIVMQSNVGYTILVGQKHRLEAIEASIVIEASIFDKGETIRLTENEFESMRSDTENLKSSID